MIWLFLKCEIMKQTSDNVVEVKNFDDIKNAHQWKRELRPKEYYSFLSKIYGGLSGLNLGYSKDFVNNYSSLFKTGELLDRTTVSNLIGKPINSFNSSLNRNKGWKEAFNRIRGELEAGKLVLYVPTDNVTQNEVIAGVAIPLDIKPDLITTVKDTVKEIVEEASESYTKNESKKTATKTVNLDKASINAINKKEPSVEEQVKNTVSKIAKSKELMNLSKEQLKDYLRDAYEISDENALNNMMNAIVAKRAELLANKQLKQEELTEIDIGRLQEQSQRDFEKKLNDQNLRYILPAQIEKRERLVQNRLNPELLKGGY